MMNRESGIRKVGRYDIIEEIGRGGMAVVYLGHDADLHRDVAIKVLPETLTHDEQFVQRFRDEAVMAARLHHPNIVTIYDVGQAGSLYYIVMQFLPGANLDRVIEHNGPLPLETCVGIACRIADALDAAHQHGIIHRDVKPSNVMISPEGNVTLMDFGLVRAAESSSHITRTGTVVGTPEYMSPEQAQGEPVDNRTDVYSLGVVIYKMLNGVSPFSRSTPLATLLAQTKDPVSFNGLMAKLPREIKRVLERAMAKSPANRYASAGALAADLVKAAGVQPNRPIVVRLPPPYGPAAPAIRAPGAAAVAGAAAGSAAAGAATTGAAAAGAAATGAAASGAPPTALSQPPSAGGGRTAGTQGRGAAPPAGRSGNRSWLFAMIPLLLLVAAGVGFFAVRAGSRAPTTPVAAPPAFTGEPTATISAKTIPPTSTLAVVEPALTVPDEAEVVATSTPLAVETSVEAAATSTPLPTSTPVATAAAPATSMPLAASQATSTPMARATTARAPTTTPAAPTAAPSPRPKPTRAASLPAPALIAPADGATASGPVRFEWTWSGPALEPNQGFEVRIWRGDQADHYGAASPVTDTSLTTDVSQCYAVQQGGSGSYLWTVALVQRDPYMQLGPEAPPRVLSVTTGGGSDGTQPW